MQEVFGGSGQVIRRCRVSGLWLRHRKCRGPVWRCADRVQLGYARSDGARPGHWFTRSRLDDRLPLLHLRPSHI